MGLTFETLRDKTCYTLGFGSCRARGCGITGHRCSSGVSTGRRNYTRGADPSMELLRLGIVCLVSAKLGHIGIGIRPTAQSLTRCTVHIDGKLGEGIASGVKVVRSVCGYGSGGSIRISPLVSIRVGHATV